MRGRRLRFLKLLLAVGATCALTVAGALLSGASAGRSLALDGRVIAFERSAGGVTDIYLVNVDGSGVRKLVRGCCFDWSPDGGQIAFKAMDSRIKVVNVDGTGERSLTGAQDSGLDPVDWSVRGQIVFTCDLSLCVVNADGRGLRRLTRPRNSDYRPRSSPNGRFLAFERVVDDPYGFKIHVIDAAGSTLRRVADGPGDDRKPTWSPGGRKLAFYRAISTGAAYTRDIYVVNVDGSGVVNLTRTPSANDVDPVWSPTGRRIAFASAQDIHVIGSDGRRHRRLTRTRAFEGEPAWSPDGRSIAFVSGRDGNWDIYVMSAIGRNPVNLTNTTGKTGHETPLWSPTRR